jgi:neutral ceramidase
MSTLFAAIARRDITPPLGTPLFGYSNERRADEVADPLNATALVLRSGDITAVIVSLDWGQIDEAETAVLRALIHERTGIAPLNITFCATHTHSAPETVNCWGWAQKNFPYLEMARVQIIDAIETAQRELQPVRVGIGTTKTETGINRREVVENGNVGLGFQEWGAYDDTLTVLRLEGENGPVAQLVHLAAHPTARGFADAAITRDWPGVMMDRVEQITGTTVLFINGAFGDAAPRTSWGGAVGDGAPAVREVGLRAAHDAVTAWRGIKEFRDLELGVLSEDFELPYAPLPPQDEAQRELAARAHVLDANGKPGIWGNDVCEWNYWNAVVQAHTTEAETGHPQTCLTFQQTITRIGPIAIVPFSGEVFAETSLRLRKASPFTHTLVAGATNGGQGYYVTRDARARGGFEIGASRAYRAHLFTDNIDDVLVSENLALLRNSP